MAKGAYIGAKNFEPSPLPSGYTQVEYIESTGTQRIDSGVVPGSNDFALEMDIMPNPSYTEPEYFTTININKTSGPAGFLQFGIRTSIYTLHIPDVGYYGTVPADEKRVHITVNVSGSQISMSGDISYSASNNYLSTGTYRNYSISICEKYWRCYRCKIYISGNLVRDFIPCRNAANIIGLYDTVNDQFYANAGTGTFIAGNTYSSVARKIKKGYIGVSDVARKIKKAYIGVGGVARLFFGSGELSYYGTATALSYARGALAATTVGNYALFGGGGSRLSSESSSNATSTVNAYDLSLTMSSATSLSSSRSFLAATSIGGYAIFAGGSESSKADGYDTSLTRISLTNLSEGKDRLAATTVGNYALFSPGRATGDEESYITYKLDAYDSSLTLTSKNWLNGCSANMAATTVGNCALFAGRKTNSVDVFDSSLTQTSATNLTQMRESLGAASVGDYALFGGGLYSSTYYSYVDSYNSSLTKSSVEPLSVARRNLVGASLGDFALFAGGGTSYSSSYATTDSYDASLTKTTATSLSVARQCLAATKLNDYALFGGGFTTSATAKTNTVDVYQLV